MDAHRKKALRVEAEFLAAAETNLAEARGRTLRGSHWQTSHLDDEMAVRDLLRKRRLFDRDLLDALPHNRRVVVRGHEYRWFGLMRRPTQIAIASALAPPERYLEGGEGAAEPQPIGLEELLAHVRRLAHSPTVEHVIGVCSPTGFTEEVRRSHVDLPNVTLVAVEPRPDGGWAVHTLSGSADAGMQRLFDPDTAARRIERVREAIRARSADLITGGLSAEAIAAQLDMPAAIVAEGFRQVALEDPELRLSRTGDDVLLFRGVATSSWEADMSVTDWIRQLFGRSGDEAKKINMLSERRAMLAQRRDRLYDDIAKMEQKEHDLVEQGRQNKSQVVRRRVASQLAQHRREMSRLNTTATMLNQQINVISTHIHNLTLLQQGETAKLPDTEELTEDAVRAEEMLEQLKADADLVGSLETGVSDMIVTQDELDILKEFEEADKEEARASGAGAEPASPGTAGPEAGAPEPSSPEGGAAPPPEKGKPEAE